MRLDLPSCLIDVTAETVEVLAIITKAEAARWLAEHGTPDAPGGVS